MADAPISGLPETSVVNDNDLILLEQNNTAKKIKGSNWKQYFNANVVTASATVIAPDDPPTASYDPNTNNLALDLPSADYIVSVEKTGQSGLVDTYTVTTALGYTATFTVKNGEDGTGSPGSATPLADSSSGAVGTAISYSREDHRHPANVDNTLPENLGTAASGSSSVYARRDHVHQKPSASDIGALSRIGDIANVNPVSDLDDFVTGIGLFNDYNGVTIANFPYTTSETEWALVVCAGNGTTTAVQVAYDLHGAIQPRTRKLASGTWGSWSSLRSSASALIGTVPIDNGGTGANNATDARTNLGITPANIGAMASDALIVDSVSMGSVTTSSGYKNVSKSAAKTGYTPLAIAGWNCSNTYIFCSELRINNGNIVATFRNNQGSESTFTPTVFVLYRKD